MTVTQEMIEAGQKAMPYRRKLGSHEALYVYEAMRAKDPAFMAVRQSLGTALIYFSAMRRALDEIDTETRPIAIQETSK